MKNILRVEAASDLLSASGKRVEAKRALKFRAPRRHPISPAADNTTPAPRAVYAKAA